jgi:hypothetical protein
LDETLAPQKEESVSSKSKLAQVREEFLKQKFLDRDNLTLPLQIFKVEV